MVNAKATDPLTLQSSNSIEQNPHLHLNFDLNHAPIMHHVLYYRRKI
ncbi:hypothetical protein SAMN03084138_03958 [Enterovibrio norvegicus DSM 15893]|uniref:Uncharacterized protein n=1 Tax=Enterovibrio norvegicus DSM 15893 TaxID=1121869 RepID=A0A1I5VIA0_9GAMM|nr:hypothetical protein SAMN03084138_03958 [Enterovibrio norvegicus DSM 15893]